MDVLSQRIESARELYNVKFLNEKFGDKDENKTRKDKLKKLLENFLNDEKQKQTKPKI
jgi:hypothetical protein